MEEKSEWDKQICESGLKSIDFAGMQIPFVPSASDSLGNRLETNAPPVKLTKNEEIFSIYDASGEIPKTTKCSALQLEIPCPVIDGDDSTGWGGGGGKKVEWG